MQLDKLIFLFGSRTIQEIPMEMKKFLLNKIDEGYSFLIGDCSGSDEILQEFLADSFANVIVHHIGEKPRVYRKHINSSSYQVDGINYIDKDIFMTIWCTKAVGLWDLKSKGSKRNIEHVMALNKECIIFTPQV